MPRRTEPSPASPYLAQPDLAEPHTALPNLAKPRHTCLAAPRSATRNRAKPCQTSPCNAAPSLPCHAKPHQTQPCLATSRPTWPDHGLLVLGSGTAEEGVGNPVRVRLVGFALDPNRCLIPLLDFLNFPHNNFSNCFFRSCKSRKSKKASKHPGNSPK